MVISLFLVLVVVTAALSIYDGIARVRGRRANSALAVVEIIVAALLLVVQFVALPSPLTTFWLSLVLEVVLVIILLARGTRSRGVTLVTVIALVLNAVVLLMSAGWLHIPGIN